MTAREYLARSGPEDFLTAIRLPPNKDREFVTAGAQYAVVVEKKQTPRPLDFPDVDEFLRFKELSHDSRPATLSGVGDTLKELDSARHMCAKPAYNYEVRACWHGLASAQATGRHLLWRIAGLRQ